MTRREPRPPEPCMGCARAARAVRKLDQLERLMAVWARGRDVVLGKAAAKVLRRLMEVE